MRRDALLVWHWLSTARMTVAVGVDADQRIRQGPPIVGKFRGRPLETLRAWLDKQPGLRQAEMAPSFGAISPHLAHRRLSSVYLIVSRDRDVALVRTPEGLRLPSGDLGEEEEPLAHANVYLLDEDGDALLERATYVVAAPSEGLTASDELVWMETERAVDELARPSQAWALRGWAELTKSSTIETI